MFWNDHEFFVFKTIAVCKHSTFFVERTRAVRSHHRFHLKKNGPRRRQEPFFLIRTTAVGLEAQSTDEFTEE